jgi:hypothetical protein
VQVNNQAPEAKDRMRDQPRNRYNYGSLESRYLNRFAMKP